MEALDLFSGQRTALAAFKDWDITYIDIINGNDIRKYTPEHKFDFIWASPPCIEYTIMSPRTKYKIPDRELWYEAFRCIDRGKRHRNTPWVIENVAGAQYWFGRPRDHCGAWFFWGWYPKVNFPNPPPTKGFKGTYNKPTIYSPPSRQSVRIPYSISKAFCKAIENNGKP